MQRILKIIRKHNLYTTITVSGNIITDTQKYGLIPEYRPEIIETESLEKYIDKIERPIIKFSIVDEENAYLVQDKINGLYNSIISVAENAVALLDRQLIGHFKEVGNKDYEKYGPKRIVVFNNPQSSPTNQTSDTEREI